jgi:glycosyltransferase involved in cell wall biosynthesis
MVGAENNAFGYDVDYTVRWRTMTHSRQWQNQFLDTLATSFTHVLIEAEMPILGGLHNEDLRRQISTLRERGLAVGMICHGTDVRLPSRHAALEPWSFLADNEWVPLRLAEAEIQANLDLLEEVAAPTFVSTPGLLVDVPYGHLLPVVILPSMWNNTAPVLERMRPRVLHVPSNAVTKGTHKIAPVLERLHEEGLIEYVQSVGLEHSEMPDLYASTDVVLDQFRSGDYGVAACEAMAAGRIVVSHVSDRAREIVSTETGIDLPIVEATIDSLEVVLRDILAHPDHYRTVAARGPAFVDEVHDGRMSRQALEAHFLEA